jgi:DeoR/GlpR family transcriptional regulator of sugar metabolism
MIAKAAFTKDDIASALIGSQATEMLKNMWVNRLFLGTKAIDAKHG